jgi:hypothetical protein
MAALDFYRPDAGADFFGGLCLTAVCHFSAPEVEGIATLGGDCVLLIHQHYTGADGGNWLKVQCPDSIDRSTT